MHLAISVVVPFFDEVGHLTTLHRQLTRVLDARGEPYEILLIDDGSTDGSGSVAIELAHDDPRVGYVRLRRRVGRSAALDAGLRRARGRVVVIMGADLDDSPQEIPQLLDALDAQDLDLVSGRRSPVSRRLRGTLSSRLGDAVARFFVGFRLRGLTSGFHACRREAVEGLPLHGELHRYVPVLVDTRGFAVGDVRLEPRPRRRRTPPSGGARARGLFELLTVLLLARCGHRPLHLFGWAGLLLIGLGLACLSVFTVLWALTEGPLIAHALLPVGMLLSTMGIQLVSTGLLGELVNGARGPAPRFVVQTEIAAISDYPEPAPAPTALRGAAPSPTLRGAVPAPALTVDEDEIVTEVGLPDPARA